MLDDLIRTTFKRLDPESTHVLSREDFRLFARKLIYSFIEHVLELNGYLNASDMEIDALWISIEGIWTEHRGVTLSKLLWCKTVFEWKLEDARKTVFNGAESMAI